ncbi:hypothetical protein GCM10027605_53160 [Micromonospora zhanjiangensis]
MADLTTGARRAGHRAAVHDEAAADADVDEQVQGRTRAGGGTRAGLGDAGQRGVVADQQRQAGVGDEYGQVHRTPAERGGLDHPTVPDGRGGGHRHRTQAPAVAVVDLSHRSGEGGEDAPDVARSVPLGARLVQAPVESGHGPARFLLTEFHGQYEWTVGMRPQHRGGPAASDDRRRLLAEQPAVPQPGRDLGGRATGEAQVTSEVGAGGVRPVAQVGEHLGGDPPTSRPGAAAPHRG